MNKKCEYYYETRLVFKVKTDVDTAHIKPARKCLHPDKDFEGMPECMGNIEKCHIKKK